MRTSVRHSLAIALKGARTTTFAAAAFAVPLLAASVAVGQVESGDGGVTNPLAGVNIVKVEEDWLLDVASPEPDSDLPQIVTVFGPTNPSTGTHAVFELNHGTLPSFGQGGMQLQVWWGSYLVGYESQFAPNELNVAIERITYTTKVRVEGGQLYLYVKNGHSLTWGDFPTDEGSGHLHIAVNTTRTNLNDWSSANSINNSRVSYGANRVNKFMRTAIRYYTSDSWTTPYYTDDTDTYIHQLTEDLDAPPPVNE
jgi:hypothetical protein